MFLAITDDVVLTAGAIVLAAIIGIAGPIVIAFRKLRHENSTQHAEGRLLVQHLTDSVHLMHKDVNLTKDTVHDHISWHAHEGATVES